MIVLNSVKFAESESEMIDSLFSDSGTCSGYAKRLKHKIKLFDLQKKSYWCNKSKRVFM